MPGGGDWPSGGRGAHDPRQERPDYLGGGGRYGDSYIDEDSGSWPAELDDSGGYGPLGGRGERRPERGRYADGPYPPGSYRDPGYGGGRNHEPPAPQEYEMYEQDGSGGAYGQDRHRRDSAGWDQREPYPGGQHVSDWGGQNGYGPSASYQGREQWEPSGQDQRYGSDMAQGWGGLGQHPDARSGRDAEATSAYQRPGEYGDSGSGSFGRDDDYRSSGRAGDQASSGTFGWAGSGSFDPADSASFRRPDTGSHRRPDTGSHRRPDSGSHRRPESGSFDLADSGVFDPADSGVFGRPDGGQFGRHNGGSGGYGDWQDDADEQDMWDGEDEDWEDEDSGLLSRRFGRGNGGGDAGDSGGKGRRPKRRRFRGSAAFLIAMVVVIAMIGGAGFFGYKYVHAYITDRYGDYTGPGTGRVTVTVENGYSLEQLGPMLLQKGVIMALRPYDSAAGKAANASTLQPGTYYLHKHMNAALAVQLLLSGKSRVVDQFTVLPDARAADIAVNLHKKTGIAESQFLAIINHPPASLGMPKWAAGHSAEGFLYPDTYTLAPHESALQILRAMVSDFNSHVGSLGLPAAAPKVFTTPYHMIVVASLIQAEGNAQDFGQVSRVVWNRLQKNMLLEFDSTVFYAMHSYGTSITKAQEHYPSPYNTYLHTGLPPGPIGSPSLAAIDAALHPADGHWLYFITDVKSPTHKTYFADTLQQFDLLQQKYG
jgi:uncharacterized YceG family protein